MISRFIQNFMIFCFAFFLVVSAAQITSPDITSPLYINPLPVELVVNSGLPVAIEGTCDEGSVFTVSSVDDLVANLANLECIFNAGVLPLGVPLGLHYGAVLKFGTSDSLTMLFAPFWKGKLLSHLRCPDGNDVFLGLNMVQGRLRVAARVSIGTPEIVLAPFEFSDHKPSLLIDYTQPFDSMCQAPPGSIYDESDLSLKPLNNVYPFRMVLDVVRLVGRQQDGGAIYLGKTYVRDPFRPDGQAYNVAFWSTVNYDSTMSSLKPGESLPPLASTFSYKEPGAFQGKRLMFPFDNLLVDPLNVVDRFFFHYEAFSDLLRERTGIDLNRVVKQAGQIHVSGLEYIVVKLSTILAVNPTLLNFDRAAEAILDYVVVEQPVQSLTSLKTLLKSGLAPMEGEARRRSFASDVHNIETFSTLTDALRKFVRTVQATND